MVRGKCPFSGKTVYPTRRDARQALAAIRERRATTHVERKAYTCPFCKGWHITREPERPHTVTTRMPPHQRWRWNGSVQEEE